MLHTLLLFLSLWQKLQDPAGRLLDKANLFSKDPINIKQSHQRRPQWLQWVQKYHWWLWAYETILLSSGVYSAWWWDQWSFWGPSATCLRCLHRPLLYSWSCRWLLLKRPDAHKRFLSICVAFSGSASPITKSCTPVMPPIAGVPILEAQSSWHENS